MVENAVHKILLIDDSETVGNRILKILSKIPSIELTRDFPQILELIIRIIT
jgi:hypothetical protein